MMRLNHGDNFADFGSFGAGMYQHTAVSGDTLSKLALEYYGDASEYQKIADANPQYYGEDADPRYSINTVGRGWKLNIPDSGLIPEEPLADETSFQPITALPPSSQWSIGQGVGIQQEQPLKPPFEATIQPAPATSSTPWSVGQSLIDAGSQWTVWGGTQQPSSPWSVGQGMTQQPAQTAAPAPYVPKLNTDLFSRAADPAQPKDWGKIVLTGVGVAAALMLGAALVKAMSGRSSEA